MHGWFSKYAADRFGFAVWLNAKGERVQITEVTKEKTANSLWDDLRYVGEIEKCIEPNKKQPDYSSMAADQIISHIELRDEEYEKEQERLRLVALERLKWS